MRKATALLGTSILTAMFAQPTYAADLDHEQRLGLIVSGVVDKWAGVQHIEGPGRFITRALPPQVEVGELESANDTVFTTGLQGLLSLPVGDKLSIQHDLKFEANTNATVDGREVEVFGPRYHYQAATHLSRRDPSIGLLGAFGGIGFADFQDFKSQFRFVGGEAQFYLDNLTFYVQGGGVAFESGVVGGILGRGLDQGYFVRGVLRWFPSPETRLQLEGGYLTSNYQDPPAYLDENLGDMKAFVLGTRYDFTWDSLPFIGNLPIYLAYRGTFRDGCAKVVDSLTNPDVNIGFDLNDHTIMIGASYSFSDNRLAVDRQGATLDTPDFNHSCVAQPTASVFSDRRLKMDVVELENTAEGLKLYSWKYKSDPVTTWVGVMAQDLVETHPEALETGSDGFYRVRYDRFGVQMMTLEQWNNRRL
jgi:hypothetical protein